MTTETERALLTEAVEGFDRALAIADDGDALKSIAVSLATAGRGIAKGLLDELEELEEGA